MFSVMFQNLPLCIACLCSFFMTYAICTQTFYKLVGNDDDASVADENVPFLTQSFFACGPNEDCTKVAKIESSSDFKEMIGQQKVKEDAVVYQKMEKTRIIGKFPLALSIALLLLSNVSTKTIFILQAEYR